MEPTVRLKPDGPFAQPAHPVTGALLVASAVLLHLAGRLERRRQQRPVPHREFAALEVGGEAGGAVFEDGKLVGYLPGVRSL